MTTSPARDLLSSLNPQQREAAQHIEGPLLILAGPGSGKTRVITYRIAYLVKEVGVNPRRIMALTFTNKAAKEMRERLDRLLGQRATELSLGTFHSQCAAILRRDGMHLGLDRNFHIYDDEDQMTVVKQSLQGLDLDSGRYPPRAILSAISRAKSQMQDAEQFAAAVDAYYEEIVARVYRRYESTLISAQAVDFDDLLMKTHQLLADFPDAAEHYQGRYLHLLIDEFQDTNIVQYSIARLLAQKHRNIAVVGDPDQSIYSWRNADLRNILSFQHDYPEARVVTMEENYRSTKTILEGAHNVISSNRQRLDKGLFTQRDQGESIVVAEAYNPEEEALYVLQEVDRLRKDNDLPLNGVAVMYRVNSQSRAFEETCLRFGVPYRLVGGVRFYQRREVKDVITYLRVVNNPHDDISLARIVNAPARGIGQRSLEDLTHWARQRNRSLWEAMQAVVSARSDGGEAPPLASRPAGAIAGFTALITSLIEEAQRVDIVTLLDDLLERINYKQHLRSDPDRGEERWDNVKELRGVALQYQDWDPGEGLFAFLENVALVADVDRMDEAERDALTLITLHQAKGLEFPVVFMTGMEEGVLPHSRSMDDPDAIEEERRLTYVGMTRAQERLYMVRAFRRGFGGASMPTAPSRFLADIPDHITSTPMGVRQTVTPARQPSYWPGARTAAPDAPAAEAGPSPFKVGEKVRHNKFGEGVVINCIATNDDYEVTVAFRTDAGIKRLLASFAPLERVEEG